MELAPNTSCLEELKGKYRHRFKSDWEVLEEKKKTLSGRGSPPMTLLAYGDFFFYLRGGSSER